ncbi:MAG TPA: DciA family protein [Blastocatellia bacterium]|nr:DciA family protein [Blastocatellia bacterium]
MNSLLKMLPMIMRLAGDNEEVREQAVFVAWRAGAGAGVANVCEPFRLYRKQLIVAVLDSAWKKHMENISGEYLFKINSMLNAPLVTFIEFRVDREYVLQSRKGEERTFEFHRTQELEEELRSSAACIRDEALRDRFLRAAAKCLERREA